MTLDVEVRPPDGLSTTVGALAALLVCLAKRSAGGGRHQVGGHCGRRQHGSEGKLIRPLVNATTKGAGPLGAFHGVAARRRVAPERGTPQCGQGAGEVSRLRAS